MSSISGTNKVREPELSVQTTANPLKDGGTRSRRRLIEALIMVALAVAGALAAKSFLLQVYSVPSGSMSPTVIPGERIAVEKVSYDFRDPRRGDVVVFDGTGYFRDPTPGAHVFVKRVIGVGGDRVTCCTSTGQLTVNGQVIDEQAYVGAPDVPSTMRFDVEVPPDSLWLMGDHRSASADSRVYIGSPGGGMVPVKQVIGRVFSVVWPINQARLIGSQPAPAGK